MLLDWLLGDQLLGIGFVAHDQRASVEPCCPAAYILMSKPASPPSNWPADLQYLICPSPSARLPKDLRAKYCTPSPSTPNPSPRVAIRLIKDPNHPAHGQRGMFNASSKKLEPGLWIRDYIGVVHTDLDSDPTSEYDLSLERRTISPSTSDGLAVAPTDTKDERDAPWTVVAIDATKAGNEARFVNDFRGVANKPNAVFELREWRDCKTGQVVGRRMAIWAGPKGVDKNAEICVSYGKGFWRERRQEAGATDG
ncbi:hypothetical protein ACM66B_004003 [Microbotryomycetes sp. NB124-2]